ncbi:MAG: LysM domain-containing protein [Candidatus Roizmanbacteria bacterium]
MKKKYVKALNYQQLFLTTVKEKYFNLVLGMLVSLLISSFVYKSFLKNIPINLAFSLPVFKQKTSPTFPKSPTTLKTYTVAEGDDLWNIAEKFYGSGFNAYDISVANKMNDASILETGQKIIIPKVTPREPTVGEISASSTSQVTYVEGKYVVQPGDSLSNIALKVYGDLFAWPRILQANNLLNPDQVEVGMILNIPR